MILLVGDSFTHCYAPFEDKWGTRVEKLLNYRVLKCGVSGYGTRQELIKAQEIINLTHQSPRLIIVGYFMNDLSDDYSFPNLTAVDGFLVESAKYKDKKTNQLLDMQVLEKHYSWREKLTGDYPVGRWDLATYFLDQHLILINLINDAATKLFPPKDSYTNHLDFLAFHAQEPWIEKAWSEHLENLKAFKDLAAAQGAELLIVLIPTNTQVYPSLCEGRDIDLELPNRILGEFLRRERIGYLDLLPLLRRYADATPRKFMSPDKDLYWRANSHWSIKGEHLAGLLVSRYILENNLVQTENREARLKEIEDKLSNFH